MFVRYSLTSLINCVPKTCVGFATTPEGHSQKQHGGSGCWADVGTAAGWDKVATGNIGDFFQMATGGEAGFTSKGRGVIKGQVTKNINKLKRYVAEQDLDNIQYQLSIAKQNFAKFEYYHEQYHATLDQESEIESSDAYFEEVERIYTEIMASANNFVTANVKDAKCKIVQDESVNAMKCLTSQISLPALSLDVFSGDPMKYNEFMSVFDETVHSKPLDDQVKLSRLLQFTSGNARSAIRQCALLGGSTGYSQAREILFQRFGNSYVITHKIIDNLKHGKSVSGGIELEQLADDICMAHTTLKGLNMLSELENQQAIIDILQRCPRYVRFKWQKKALAMKHDKQQYPTFPDFVNFIRRIASESVDPLYGSSNMKSSGGKNDSKGSNFGTMGSGSFGSKNSGVTDCKLCDGKHGLFQCDKFKSMRPKERLDYIKQTRRCFLCLQTGHSVGSCEKKFRCTVCHRKHSKFIHIEPAKENSNEPDASGSNGSNNFKQANVYLPIIPVKLPDGQTYFALLDGGSTNSFCSSRLASKLNLKSNSANIQIDTLSHCSKIDKFVTCELRSVDGDNKVTLNNLLVVPNIPARHPRTVINLDDYPYLADLPLGHVTQQVKADLLIGNDHADLLVPYDVRCNPAGGNHPYATRSYFGWSLAGPVPGNGAGGAHHGLSHAISGRSIEDQIESLWAIESDNLDKYEASPQDQRVLDLWEEEIYMEDSHYVLPIPWKNDSPDLPYNFYMAHNRLTSLFKRLDRDGIRAKYDQGIQNLLDRGYAEHVPSDQLNLRDGSVFYLPHHPVISEAKPGKVRVVMDCAAKFHGVSLNSQCLMGPDLLNKLLHVVLRFRQYECALVGDIEKMYLNCKVAPKDRNALRFLYHDENGNLIHLRMQSHLYGGVWCSALATFCLRRICRDFDCSPLVTDVIYQSFYVDDLARSVIDAVEGCKVIRETRSALMKGSFNLTQIYSNSSVINESIEPACRADAVKDLDLNVTSKCLGIKWDIQADQFIYQFRLMCPGGSRVTRRSVLSQVSSMYDPLGLTSCVQIRGRLLFQELTRLKLPWDDVIPRPILCKWQSWVHSLTHLENIKFDRCLIPKDFVGGVSELVLFSDASKYAYGALAYIRTINRHGNIHVKLLIGKARLVPLKGLTIPRAELCGALIAARLNSVIKDQLDVDLVSSTFFTDSRIVLSYIKNEEKRYKTFVANRVAEIRSSSRPESWFHIESSQNPSDILSRGCNASDIPIDWFKGPSFLSDFKCNWPKPVESSILLDKDPEVIIPKVCCHTTPIQEKHPIDKLSEHYSDFYRMKKALAWLLKVKHYLKHKSDKVRMAPGPLTADDLRQAECMIVKHVQQQFYEDEISCLRQGHRVAKKSPILKLDPILKNDVLVVGGRLRYSQHVEHKHPIVLPRQDRVSKLIIQEYHGSCHLGVEWTLSRLRSKFWIVGARNLLKAVSRSCVVCKKLFGRAAEQKMSNLPPSRVEPFLPAFAYTGLDIFGNFYVKVNRSKAKRYGIVFTCFNTRACHIEVLNSLTSSDFICALIRFFSRRGRSRKLFCDCATTFIGAYNELTKSQEQLNRTQIMQFTRKLDVEWCFNTPHASHHGGVWERIIRTIRKVIAAIIPPNVDMTDDQLTTYFCEAECIINGRPLTKCSDDINDESPLTPNHFLLLSDNVSVPLGHFVDSDLYRRRWRHVQFLVNCFWKRWIRSYLPILQSRQRWPYVRDNIEVGNLVLMIDETMPRSQYPMALVVDVMKGRDDLVRSVRLRSRGKVYVRPITKVIFLEGGVSSILK